MQNYWIKIKKKIPNNNFNMTRRVVDIMRNTFICKGYNYLPYRNSESTNRFHENDLHQNFNFSITWSWYYQCRCRAKTDKTQMKCSIIQFAIIYPNSIPHLSKTIFPPILVMQLQECKINNGKINSTCLTD